MFPGHNSALQKFILEKNQEKCYQLAMGGQHLLCSAILNFRQANVSYYHDNNIMTSVFKIRAETCRTEAQFCQNVYMIKNESLPDWPKFCLSGSAVQHLFWRLWLGNVFCITSPLRGEYTSDQSFETPRRSCDVIVMTLVHRTRQIHLPDSLRTVKLPVWVVIFFRTFIMIYIFNMICFKSVNILAIGKQTLVRHLMTQIAKIWTQLHGQLWSVILWVQSLIFQFILTTFYAISLHTGSCYCDIQVTHLCDVVDYYKYHKKFNLDDQLCTPDYINKQHIWSTTHQISQFRTVLTSWIIPDRVEYICII